MKVCRKCLVEKEDTEFYSGRRVCKLCVCARVSGYYAADKESWKARVSKYKREHREQYNAWNRRWRDKNPEQTKLLDAKRNAKNRSTIHGRLRDRVGSYLRIMLKQGKNGVKTEQLLGYTMEDLRKHLESKFTDGMSWDRFDEWHIDHVKPVSMFKFSSVDDPEFKECWALSNLQPLWALDNLRKGNKYSCEAKS